MNVTVVRSLQENKWKQFVEQSLDGNIFHTPEMFQVFAHTRDTNPHCGHLSIMIREYWPFSCLYRSRL